MENNPINYNKNILHSPQNLLALSAVSLVIIVWTTLTFLNHRNIGLNKEIINNSGSSSYSTNSLHDPIVSCNDIKTFQSAKQNISIECPEKMYIFECERDINLYSFSEVERLNLNINSNWCDNRQGTIQILFDEKPQYDGSVKNNASFKVKEEQIIVGGQKAIRQRLEYSGANIPSYSEFVTFSKNGEYYRIRLLNKELLPQFDQILSTFKFTDIREYSCLKTGVCPQPLCIPNEDCPLPTSCSEGKCIATNLIDETDSTTACNNDRECWCRNFDGSKFLPGKVFGVCNMKTNRCNNCYYE